MVGISTDNKLKGINPYQEMGKCTQCESMHLLFMGGYNVLENYNAILKCAKCGNVFTKLIKNN